MWGLLRVSYQFARRTLQGCGKGDGRQKFDEAAGRYIALVDENPKFEFADSALNNAAVCFEKDKRYDSASKMYQRIFDSYPKSSLADTALFRVAVNAERFFDFNKAVLVPRLVKEYPKSPNRADALQRCVRAGKHSTV